MTATEQSPRPRQGSREGRRSRAGLVVLVVLVTVAVGTVGLWVARRALSPSDYRGSGSGSVNVEIIQGESATAIGQTLTDADVVASTQAFVDAAVADPRSLGIQPGFYDMRLKMSAQAALDRLLDPAARIQVQVTVPEGLRVDQVVDRLVAASDLPRSDFERALRRPARLGLPAYAQGSAEGFLFPATYTFDPGTSALAMLQAMVDRFDQAAQDVDLVRRALAVNLTPRQAVTVASLVQAEVAERDFGKAARVVYNRLNLGMPLQFDSTVNFALNSDDLTLTNDQLAVDSPYNTYVHPGLPPGPINSPGQAAIEAALAPADGNWVYFVARAPGSDQTRFTADYAQFLKWKDEFYAAVTP
jgi:UPF0755 protein